MSQRWHTTSISFLCGEACRKNGEQASGKKQRKHPRFPCIDDKLDNCSCAVLWIIKTPAVLLRKRRQICPKQSLVSLCVRHLENLVENLHNGLHNDNDLHCYEPAKQTACNKFNMAEFLGEHGENYNRKSSAESNERMHRK